MFWPKTKWFATHFAMTFFRNVKTAKTAISDKYILHLSRYCNHYNARTWGNKNNYALIAGTRDSPTFTVFCAVSIKEVSILGCFHFGVHTVTCGIYLDLLHEFPSDFQKRGSIWQGIPARSSTSTFSHYSLWLLGVRVSVETDRHMQPYHWSTLFPDLTQLDFWLGGYINDTVYIPPLLTTLPELPRRIATAMVMFTPTMLQGCW